MYFAILVILLRLLTTSAIEIHRGGQFEADSIYGINCTGNMDIIVRNNDTKSLVGCKCQNKDAIYASNGNRMECVDPDIFRRSLVYNNGFLRAFKRVAVFGLLNIIAACKAIQFIEVWDWDVSTKTSKWNRDFSKEFANHIFYEKQTRSIQIQPTKTFNPDGLILKVTLDCGDFNVDTILIELEGSQKYPLRNDSIFLTNSQKTTKSLSQPVTATTTLSTVAIRPTLSSTVYIQKNKMSSDTRTVRFNQTTAVFPSINSTRSTSYLKPSSILQQRNSCCPVSCTLRHCQSEISNSLLLSSQTTRETQILFTYQISESKKLSTYQTSKLKTLFTYRISESKKLSTYQTNKPKTLFTYRTSESEMLSFNQTSETQTFSRARTREAVYSSKFRSRSPVILSSSKSSGLWITSGISPDQSQSTYSFQSCITMTKVKAVTSTIVVSAEKNGLQQNAKDNNVTIVTIMSGIINAILIGVIALMLTRKKVNRKGTDTELKLSAESDYDVIENYAALKNMKKKSAPRKPIANTAATHLIKENDYSSELYERSNSSLTKSLHIQRNIAQPYLPPRRSFVPSVETTFTNDTDYEPIVCNADKDNEELDTGEYNYAYESHSLPKDTEQLENNNFSEDSFTKHILSSSPNTGSALEKRRNDAYDETNSNDYDYAEVDKLKTINEKKRTLKNKNETQQVLNDNRTANRELQYQYTNDKPNTDYLSLAKPTDDNLEGTDQNPQKEGEYYSMPFIEETEPLPDYAVVYKAKLA